MRFIIALFVVNTPLFSAEIITNEGKDDAAKIEIVLRQQRELEADQLILTADKNMKGGSYFEAIETYKKAIPLYLKSSASEKRIINKVRKSRLSLANSYKLYAEQILKQAEKESSVELFNKAKGLLNEASKTAKLAVKN